jgi:glycine cleavage system transcriptional repressor
MNDLLVITISGREHLELLPQVTQTILNCTCRVTESRYMLIAGQCVLILSLQGDWNNLARLENALNRLSKKLGLSLAAERADSAGEQRDLLPFAAEIIGTNRTEIMQQLTRFCAERRIVVFEMATQSHNTARTGARLCAINLTLGVPAELSLASLREDFLDQCDRLNVDAVLEPVKS